MECFAGSNRAQSRGIDCNFLKPTGSYAPLMDVRAWIVQDQKICLVRGQGEDTWALPGGFGEVGYSPKENIQKEVQEETGFSVEVEFFIGNF